MTAGPTDRNGTGREQGSRPVALSGLMARPLKRRGGGRVAARPDKRGSSRDSDAREL